MNEATGEEIVRYDLGEDFSVETAIVVGELYRHSGEWKFSAVGAGYKDGLGGLVKDFGLA
ncbi:General stress protein 16U [compost metagenome]